MKKALSLYTKEELVGKRFWWSSKSEGWSHLIVWEVEVISLSSKRAKIEIFTKDNSRRFFRSVSLSNLFLIED